MRTPENAIDSRAGFPADGIVPGAPLADRLDEMTARLEHRIEDEFKGVSKYIKFAFIAMAIVPPIIVAAVLAVLRRI